MSEKITILDLLKAKQSGRKIVSISCYDFTTAVLASKTDIQMIIVGDSAAQVILGYDTTLKAEMDFMVTITSAVRRGAQALFLVADMPFLSYQVTIQEAIRNAGRFLTEAGAQIVKIEANEAQLDVIKAVSEAGIAVMAHIGIKPQNITKLGKLKAEGTTADMAFELITLAKKMVQAGASMLLIEGTAAEVASIITKQSEVPVISCGSGPECDGQVLVVNDILGLTQGRGPKFAKSYDNLSERTVAALEAYAEEVTEGKYPDAEHSYHMKSGQLEILQRKLGINTHK